MNGHDEKDQIEKRPCFGFSGIFKRNMVRGIDYFQLKSYNNVNGRNLKHHQYIKGVQNERFLFFIIIIIIIIFTSTIINFSARVFLGTKTYD